MTSFGFDRSARCPPMHPGSRRNGGTFGSAPPKAVQRRCAWVRSADVISARICHDCDIQISQRSAVSAPRAEGRHDERVPGSSRNDAQPRGKASRPGRSPAQRQTPAALQRGFRRAEVTPGHAAANRAPAALPSALQPHRTLPGPQVERVLRPVMPVASQPPVRRSTAPTRQAGSESWHACSKPSINSAARAPIPPAESQIDAPTGCSADR